MTKMSGYRLSETTLEHLDYLSMIFKMSPAKVISNLINAEWDRYMDNPTAKLMIEKLGEMQEIVNELNVLLDDSEDDSNDP